jgi:hypothetical protein
MRLGTFRDPEVLYEEEPEGSAGRSHCGGAADDGGITVAGTTTFTGLKRVSVRALRAEVKNTPYEFVFDHPDDNETVRRHAWTVDGRGLMDEPRSAFGLACRRKRVYRRCVRPLQ